MEHRPDFFQQPDCTPMRQYEALRAFYLEGLSRKEAAKRGGYTYKSFCNLLARFRKNPTSAFFWPPKRRPPQKPPQVDPRPERILTLRRQRNASIQQIQMLLKEEGLTASIGYIQGVFNKHGIRRLPRRSPEARSVHTLRGVRADRRALDLSSRSFHTDFGGLFLLAFDLARLDLDAMLKKEAMYGTRRIPAGCAVRSLLALKLMGLGRPSRSMADTLDQGLALFAGLNAIPKRSVLTEYSMHVDPSFAGPLMDRWYHQAMALGPPLGQGRSFDLDFHTIPYHGDQALLQKHFVSKRSRRQRGILTMLARDANARIFSYADCTVRKDTQNEAVLRFVQYWTARTGHPPKELVFDSRFTTYPNLAELNRQSIAFITLRRRYPALKAPIQTIPNNDWRKITLHNIQRKFRRPSIVEMQVNLRGYPAPIRQIVIQGLGHDQPTVLMTNQSDRSPVKLVDRYARRMVIENVISDAIDFFHMDALSSAVPLRINVDVQLTVMASVLYRLLGVRVGSGFEVAEARTIFNKLVRHTGTVTVTDDDIIVTLRTRANTPYLVNAGLTKEREPIPWLGNKVLRIQFK